MSITTSSSGSSHGPTFRINTGLIHFLTAAADGDVDGVADGLDSGLPIDAVMSVDGTWYRDPQCADAQRKLERWFPGHLREPASRVLGRTALMLAVAGGWRPIVDSLLARGASVRARDVITGWAALHYAAEADDWRLVRLLVRHAGAWVDARATDGATALHLAVGAGAAEATAELLEAGADVNALNKDARSSLSLAVRSGAWALALLLLRSPGGDAIQAGTPDREDGSTEVMDCLVALKTRAEIMLSSNDSARGSAEPGSHPGSHHGPLSVDRRSGGAPTGSDAASPDTGSPVAMAAIEEALLSDSRSRSILDVMRLLLRLGSAVDVTKVHDRMSGKSPLEYARSHGLTAAVDMLEAAATARKRTAEEAGRVRPSAPPVPLSASMAAAVDGFAHRVGVTAAEGMSSSATRPVASHGVRHMTRSSTEPVMVAEQHTRILRGSASASAIGRSTKLGGVVEPSGMARAAAGSPLGLTYLSACRQIAAQTWGVDPIAEHSPHASSETLPGLFGEESTCVALGAAEPGEPVGRSVSEDSARGPPADDIAPIARLNLRKASGSEINAFFGAPAVTKQYGVTAPPVVARPAQ